MARRAADNQLSRETRQGLTFSLVVECLHAFNNDVLPAVSKSRTLQMLRSVEDEIRVQAAYAVQRFLDENASETIPAADLFRKAVAPFLLPNLSS